MLETKSLTKRYKPKKGVPVLAIDHVNLKFPDTGMVFLLGKSGSGKSTLLNLLGGLDVYDEGEILIKGKSSKQFTQQDFDSYRNTYLGFIFQEYNVLEDFNVGANIALALELQGQKATDEKINEILDQVDLTGFGDRKPNELSGGQKQRVAIARALVKNPEIIMADEPTGALDSNTGRQILDTLKKLSKEKLVIVVSHDREFAENYADRIIELADGRVIGDIEFEEASEGKTGITEIEEEQLLTAEVASAETVSAENMPGETAVAEKESVTDLGQQAGEVDRSGGRGLKFGLDAIYVAPRYHLTEEDRRAINMWLDERSESAQIELRNAESTVGTGRVARATDESKIVLHHTKAFQLIKSKLPMKNAARIGVSGLKHKKFRLVVTILLSCIAFGLFGLSDTMGSYDNVRTMTNSIVDSDIKYASFAKERYMEHNNRGHWAQMGERISETELSTIRENTGIDVSGMYRPAQMEKDFTDQFDNEAQFTDTDLHIYSFGFEGFVEISQKILDESGMKLIAGRLPDGSKNEIAISDYLVQTFIIGGYREAGLDGQFEPIKAPKDMIGKTLEVNGEIYTVAGVVQTGFDLDRYVGLTKVKENATSADELMNFALYNELSNARGHSFIEMAMVGEGYVKDHLISKEVFREMKENQFVEVYSNRNEEYSYIPFNSLGELEKMDAADIHWIGAAKTSLNDNEIIVTERYLKELLKTGELTDANLSEMEIPELTLIERNFSGSDGMEEKQSEGIKIVGYLDAERTNHTEAVILAQRYVDTYAKPAGDYYQIAIGSMPKDKDQIKKVVQYNEGDGKKDGDVRFTLQNEVSYELNGLDAIFKEVSKVFFWIGIFFAVFASIMMATFISSSIAYKKQEIGTLRAIGARGSDVFKIFFSESFVIAMINFVLSALGTGIVTLLLNQIFRQRVGILVTVLTFGIRQILILFAVSVVVAALASFFPVNHNARKKPIDAIRNR